MINLLEIKRTSKEYKIQAHQDLSSTTHSSFIFEALKQNNRLYLVAPTGIGKTRMVEAWNRRAVLIEPTKCIKDSVNTKLDSSNVIVCNFERFRDIMKCPEDFNITETTPIILDEAHELTNREAFNKDLFDTVVKCLRTVKNPVMYMSATPTDEIKEFSEVLFIDWELKQNIVVNPVILPEGLTFRGFLRRERERNKNRKLFLFVNSKDILEKNCEITFANFSNNITKCRSVKKKIEKYLETGVEIDSIRQNEYHKACQELNKYENYQDKLNKVIDNQWFSDYKILGATCYACAGIDIFHKQDEYILIDGTTFGPERIIQAAGRWRMKDPLGRTINESVEINVVFESISVLETYREYLEFYGVKINDAREFVRQLGHNNDAHSKPIEIIIETGIKTGEFELLKFKSTVEFVTKYLNLPKQSKSTVRKGKEYKILGRRYYVYDESKIPASELTATQMELYWKYNIKLF